MTKKILYSFIITILTFSLFVVSAQAASSLADRMRGRILLQVESHGEAWYVHPDSGERYYMQDGGAAYEMMRSFGLGIKTADLAKIPVGQETRFQDTDSDSDGLPDKLEEGLKTDPTKADSDGDGKSDGDEVLQRNSDPLGSGNLIYDNTLVNRLKGKILLQIESRGEAWYLNPANGKRYYMKDGDAAYQIMRFLSLGITNADLEKISEAKQSNLVPTPATVTDGTISSNQAESPSESSAGITRSSLCENRMVNVKRWTLLSSDYLEYNSDPLVIPKWLETPDSPESGLYLWQLYTIYDPLIIKILGYLRDGSIDSLVASTEKRLFTEVDVALIRDRYAAAIPYFTDWQEGLDETLEIYPYIDGYNNQGVSVYGCYKPGDGSTKYYILYLVQEDGNYVVASFLPALSYTTVHELGLVGVVQTKKM